MRFDVITLFPELFGPFLASGVTRRAYGSGLVDVRLWNPRDHAEGNYRRVDDRPFGGGPGMVMMAPPLQRCLAAVRADRGDVAGHEAPVVLFSPIGAPLNHAPWSAGRSAMERRLAVWSLRRDRPAFHRYPCRCTDQSGRFRPFGRRDCRMALLDAVARLQPGVLHDEGSHQLDSFNPALDGLLDCPHYTRPEEWEGQAVPSELMSGHHANIERWRRLQRLAMTLRHRPELIEAARAAGRLSALDEKVLDGLR
jgi:tRNA (guanine37-N1)-methyltransferase